jgi:hypothetical protein
MVLEKRYPDQGWDLCTRQLDGGRYVSVHGRMNVGLLLADLRAGITLGTYLLNRESKVRFLDPNADDQPSAHWHK